MNSAVAFRTRGFCCHVNPKSREGLVGQCLALNCMRKNLLRILLGITRGRSSSVPPLVEKRCEAPVGPFPNQRRAPCTAPCWRDSPTSAAFSARKAHLLPLVACVRSGTSTSEKDLILSACLLNGNAAGRASGRCYEVMSCAKCRTMTIGYSHSCKISGGQYLSG